jgi:3-dehydroquinate dehydratase-2
MARPSAKPTPGGRNAGRRAASQPLVLVLSGPNLDRLGRREPEVYGCQTLDELHEELRRLAATLGLRVDCRQSNHEGALIDWIWEAVDAAAAGILINPGALTHTSYALYDALRGAGIPSVEVHISNPDAREDFRRESRVAPVVMGRVAGFGTQSYLLALRGLAFQLVKPPR